MHGTGKLPSPFLHLSTEMGMLSNKMGMLTIEMGARTSQSLCFGCSPKGPRQLGGKGLEMGQTENPDPIH